MDFYFCRIIVHGNTARVYLHNNQLDYGQTYYVTMGSGVLNLDGVPFEGFSSPCAWTFSTKARGPAAGVSRLS